MSLDYKHKIINDEERHALNYMYLMTLNEIPYKYIIKISNLVVHAIILKVKSLVTIYYCYERLILVM